MASLKETLQEDIKTAMKARDKVLLGNLRMLSAAIKQVEIDTRQELEDKDVLAILTKEVKKRQDALKFAKEAGREDLVEQNQLEIGILEKYVGKQLGETELQEIIQGLISDGAGNIGAVMGALKQTYSGRYDGKLASQLVKKLLP